jgi:siroheme synthase-like protein
MPARDPRLPRLFPLFLKLEGRPALVVGAGAVATEKADALRQAGSKVTVVAPDASPRVRELARREELVWKTRGFREDDVEGFHVVVVSTANPLVNRAVFRAASKRCIPVNVVDVPELCDFYFGRVVSARAIHPVVLAGAGPGDSGLLTVAALCAIREADVLVVDRLVSAKVIAERAPGSKLVYVGKAPRRHAVPQEMIQELLIAQARSGKRVVRLKGGDPFVYGRRDWRIRW